MTPADLDLDQAREALLPLRAALRRRALQQADGLRVEADAAAGAERARAEAEAAAMVGEARERGRREAGAAAEAARAAARRKGRQLVLVARRELYEELRRAVRAATTSVVDAAWQTRAVQDAHRTLGLDARIRRAGDAVTAEAAGRRLTWSLDELASRAVEELGDGVEEMWAP